MTDDGDTRIRDHATQLTSLAEAHRLLNRTQIAEVTGSSAFSSAIFMPGTAMVQPAAFIRGLADAVPAKIYANSPVLTLERANAVWRLKTPNGQVEAAQVILANNGDVERFGYFRRKLLHIYTYASMTEAFDPVRLDGQRDWAATPALPMGTTLRRISGADGDRLLVRSRYTYDPSLDVTKAKLACAGHQHDEKFARRFPQLRNVSMQHRWGGAMAITLNGTPAWGEVESGIFAACGCNGLGASNATASWIAAAEALAAMDTRLTSIYRGFAGPKKLPPKLATLIGAKMVLALREHRAGIE